MLRLNGEGLAALEQRVNASSGRELLTWEHRVVADYFSWDRTRVGLWIKPHIIAGIWMFLIFAVLCISLCAASVEFTPLFSYFYVPIVLGLMSFHLRQWLLLLGVGFNSIHSYFQNDTTIARVTTHSEVYQSIACSLPVASTVFIAIWCVHNGALWFDSKYIFPLLSVPSVWFGDSLVLPLFNVQAVAWLMQHIKVTKKRAFAIVISAFLLSSVVNGYLHYSWTHDPYSGFIDTQHGHLNFAGWAHATFSTLEMAFIFALLAFWVQAALSKRTQAIIASRSLWCTLGVFSSLSIADLIVKYKWALPREHVAFHLAWTDLVPLLGLVGVLMTGEKGTA